MKVKSRRSTNPLISSNAWLVVSIFVHGFMVVEIVHQLCDKLGSPPLAAGFLLASSYGWIPTIRRVINHGFQWNGLAYLAIVIVTSTVFSYSLVYMRTGLIDPDNPNQALSYETSMYFSVVTLTTLGYGDVRPTVTSRLIAASEALSGVVLMTLCLSVAITKYHSPRKLNES